MLPTMRQGTSSTIPTTPITVAPYLCHYEALPDSRRNERRLIPVTVTMLWQLLFYYCRTSHRANRDNHAVAHTTRTRRSISTGSALLLLYTLKTNYRLTNVKALPPLVTIKGEVGHPLEHRHKCITSGNTQTHSTSFT